MEHMIDKVKLALLTMQRHSWEQGVTMQAFLEMGEMETVILLAKEAVYRQHPDGRVAVIGSDGGVTDPCSVGEPLLRAYQETEDEDLKKGYDKLLDWALCKAPRNQEGIVYHIMDTKQFWIDTMYMLPPFLSAAGYHEEALKQMEGNWRALYNPGSGMLSHMWDDEEQRYRRMEPWGVGNGWAMAGIFRVLAMLPKEYTEAKELYIERVRNLIDTILPYMREDGLFHDVINDKNTFVDTNFPQMLAYTIFRGVQYNFISSDYIKFAEKMRAGAHKKVDKYGLVQDACGAPYFDKPGVAPEAQAFFLLMEAAYIDYNQSEQRITSIL